MLLTEGRDPVHPLGTPGPCPGPGRHSRRSFHIHQLDRMHGWVKEAIKEGKKERITRRGREQRKEVKV